MQGQKTDTETHPWSKVTTIYQKCKVTTKIKTLNTSSFIFYGYIFQNCLWTKQFWSGKFSQVPLNFAIFCNILFLQPFILQKLDCIQKEIFLQLCVKYTTLHWLATMFWKTFAYKQFYHHSYKVLNNGPQNFSIFCYRISICNVWMASFSISLCIMLTSSCFKAFSICLYTSL